ncbi:MAG: response regulator, partial [Clostridiales bacterium]|nr:response regulator [Clostridiales bacterium]
RYLWRGKDDVSAAPVVSRHVDAAERRFPKTLPPTGFVPAICCGDIRKEGQCGILENAGLTAFIRAPLYVGGRYWGMLSAEEIFSTRQWSESDVQLVGMIASTIAGAVARDLYEKERAEALDQAVKASKAKGDFLSNMSHEMRTPMNAIIGMTAIGRAATEVERKDYAFAKIDDASVHLLGVINDILDMSKIEANRLELSPTEFNFERMLQKVVNVVNFKVEEKRQHFYVDVDAAIPQTLVGDDQRLSQVIANLLSNAVKFTPEGGSIRLAADVDAAERDFFTLRIAVTDTGIGISEEQQARLFNSFEQAETGTSRKFGGTGLGLAISKRIVEMMGGTIRIESTLGEGATFLFTVRMERGRDAPCEDLLAPDVNWGNIRVLAVDDERETLDYFTRVANRLGIDCDVAASGEDACRLIELNGRYDVYFVDWRMPGMDGIELARRIRVLSAGKSVVTMISAAERGQIEGEARDAGVNLFLPKPLLPSSIADCINECLGVSRATAGAGGAGGGANAAGGDADGTGETAGHAVDFSGRRVLLAEDVEVNREIVLALLASTRLEIECAENGAEALRMFTESPDRYDMIFMDVQMPEMDGYEATKRIRALGAAVPRAKVIPIVAMTANVFREDIEKCLMAGMDDHVGKPLDFSDVQNKLEKYLVGIKDEIPQ